jgi:hypothetical protein
MTPARFPDSEIPGSKLAGSSPGHFAANRVLHRLSLPRHPPHALSSLTSSRQQIKARPPVTQLALRHAFGAQSIHSAPQLCDFQCALAQRNVNAEGTSPLRLAPATLSPYLQSRVDENRFDLSVESPCFQARFILPMPQGHVKHSPRFSLESAFLAPTTLYCTRSAAPTPAPSHD